MLYSITLNRNCNFSCNYCYQSQKRSSVMSEEVMEKTINFIEQHINANGIKNYSFSISGGECFLYFDKILYLLNLINKKIDDTKIKKLVDISTNASLLTEEKIKILKKYNVSLYIGFDGIKKMQEKNRFYVNKKTSFWECLKNIDTCYKMIDKNNITINFVITNNNFKYAYKTFKFLATRYSPCNISFSIAYNSDWTTKEIKDLKYPLIKISKKYIKMLNKNPLFSIKLIDKHVSDFIYETNENSICGAGKEQFSITPEGHIIACSNSVGMKSESIFYIGNIYSGIKTGLLKEFNSNLQKNINHSDCRKCVYKNRCYTYCPVSNYLASNDSFTISEKMCSLNKILLEVTDNFIKLLYKKNQTLFQKKYLN